MTSSESESSSSYSSSKNPLECAICGNSARGKHFGAVSCRACAAFFRRANAAPLAVAPCRKNGNCRLVNGNGWFHCKKCRLEKCYKAGMSSKNFQFDRDRIKAIDYHGNRILPMTLEQFVGRPHCVISCEPRVLKMSQNYIDCRFMVGKGLEVLMAGSEKILTREVAGRNNDNSLMKIAMGLQKMEEKHERNVKIIKKYGQAECMAFWERDFLRCAKFLTYFDEFQRLEFDVQMRILATVWHVWGRLDKVATTAMGRRKNKIPGDLVMFSHTSEYSVLDLKNTELDLTWCARLSNREMQFFYDTSENNPIYKIAPELIDLNPTDVELSYMFSQLIFHYAGQYFQGEILEITDKLTQSLADNLHDYYTKDRETPRYSARLAQMMKINQRIRANVLEDREKLRIALLFDVHTATFSHPEYFHVL